MFVVFLLIEKCGDNSAKFEKLKHKEDSILNSFKRRYNFNVDSLGNSLKDIKLVNSYDASTIKMPLICFGIFDDSLKFHHSLNKYLPESLTSYKSNEISTAVIVANSKKQLGYYNNGKTIAYQINTYLYFIDLFSHKVILSRILEGGMPPESKEYLHSPPEYLFGDAASKVDILKVIQEVSNKKFPIRHDISH